MKIKFFTVILFCLILNISCFGQSNIDQWIDSKKTCYDLIQEGFEVKAYDTSKIEAGNGFLILLFVTVLQKNNKVYECQEYQTLDEIMRTIDMSFVCRKLVQPYKMGVGT